MEMTTRIAIALLIVPSVWTAPAKAGDFQSGQAARAVIGQPSFSSRNNGITGTAMSISNGRLYVADSANQVLTFDLSQLPDAKADAEYPDASCGVCGFTAVMSVPQGVMPSAAAVSVRGKSVVVADPATHRVLIWHDTGNGASGNEPDVVLGRSLTGVAGSIVNPISVAYDGKWLFVGDGVLHRVFVWNGLPSSDTQPADAILGQPTSSSGEPEGPGADTIGVPSALASNGSDLFVADRTNGRILVFTPGDTALGSTQIKNSATLLSGPLAEGTLITVAGSSLADASETAPEDARKLPVELAGVTVLMNGVAIPLLAAGQAEIRAQVPYSFGGASSASFYIRTKHADGAVTITNAVALKLEPAAPGLFAFGGAEPRAGMLLHNADQGSSKGVPVTVSDSARVGDVITVWATGLGATADEYADPDSADDENANAPVLNQVRASVNNLPVEVISAVLPRDSWGIYELRIVLPPELRPDPKALLTISQAGVTSNTVTFPLRNGN